MIIVTEHIIKYKNTIIFSKYFNLKKLKCYYNKKIIFLNILCILIYIFNFYEKIIFFCKLIIYIYILKNCIKN